MDYREKMKIKMIYRDRSYYAYQAGKYLKDQLNGKDKFLFLITVFDHSFSMDYFYGNAADHNFFQMQEDFTDWNQFYPVEELGNMILKVFDQNSNFSYRFIWKYHGSKLSFDEETENNSKSIFHKKFILDHFDKGMNHADLEIVFHFYDKKVRENYLSGNYQYNDVTQRVYEAECLLKLFLKQNHVKGVEEGELLFTKPVYRYVRGISCFYSLSKSSELSSRASHSLTLFALSLIMFSGPIMFSGIFLLLLIPPLICFVGYGIQYLKKRYGEKIASEPQLSFCQECISKEMVKKSQQLDRNLQKEEGKVAEKEEVFEDFVLQELNRLLNQIEESSEDVKKELLEDAKKILSDYLTSLKEISLNQDTFGHQDDYFILKSETITSIALLEEKLRKLKEEQLKEKKFYDEIDKINRKIETIELENLNHSERKKAKGLVLTKNNVK